MISLQSTSCFTVAVAYCPPNFKCRLFGESRKENGKVCRLSVASLDCHDVGVFPNEYIQTTSHGYDVFFFDIRSRTFFFVGCFEHIKVANYAFLMAAVKGKRNQRRAHVRFLKYMRKNNPVIFSWLM